jgi:hypothetical protein
MMNFMGSQRGMEAPRRFKNPCDEGIGVNRKMEITSGSGFGSFEVEGIYLDARYENDIDSAAAGNGKPAPVSPTTNGADFELILRSIMAHAANGNGKMAYSHK